MISANLETMTDEELVLEFQRGIEPAFNRLVSRYQEKSTRLAFSMLRNWETAREISQNAFVKAYFGLKSFKRESKFGTWFFRILVNQARDEIRRRMRSKEQVMAEDVLTVIPSLHASPSQEIIMEEERKRLEAAVANLPENEQKVFVMRYFNDFSLQEIAESLGIALGTVKASLFHATQKVRKALKNVCHPGESRDPDRLDSGFSAHKTLADPSSGGRRNDNLEKGGV